MRIAPLTPRAMLSWPLPDTANPYGLRLSEALSRRGVRVRSHRYLAALCARPEGASWLHVHWPEWMLHDPDRGRYRARVAYVTSLLDLARAQGVSLAWTAHNLLGHNDPHPDLGLGARRALLGRCEVVFGHFADAEVTLRSLGYQGRFVCAPHPHAADDYPPPEDRAGCRSALGVSNEQTLLVSFGAIEGYKGLSSFARCFQAFRDEQVRWVIAGRAKDSSEYAALQAAANRDARVTIREGFATPEALAALVTASDAAVLPYREFFTSGAAMLALTMGAPLVAPPWHHFRAMVAQPFFVPLAETTAPQVARAIERVRNVPVDARDAARAWAHRARFEDLARTVDRALFGGAS